jgi:hypothetical protein
MCCCIRTQQLTQDWHRNDPDLEALHRDPRFEPLLTTAAEEQQSEGGAEREGGTRLLADFAQ